METHLRYRIEQAGERGNWIGTLEVLREAEEVNLPVVEEVLTLQKSALTGTFKVLRVDGPFHDSVDKVSYTVRLLRL